MSETQNSPEGMPGLEAEGRTPSSIDRRAAIKALTATAALFPVLPAVGQHAHGVASSPASVYTPQLIKGAQRDLLTAVCDRMIPRTGTPGAADVGVADEIDFMATRQSGIAGQVATALARVEGAAGRSFVALKAEEQDAVLRRMSEDLSSEDGKAFVALKELTIDGYYRTKGGLMQELGWNANTYVQEFKGCTHEHAAGDSEPGVAG
ncbi:MAG: gluconate 2-dehydrogenase subunit 3 family protein [Bryobacterales bacterium]|nr:gluconate 2-dehydrogenase subunit 3 family protein [Bryobacterales bacterium]